MARYRMVMVVISEFEVTEEQIKHDYNGSEKAFIDDCEKQAFFDVSVYAELPTAKLSAKMHRVE